MFILINCQGLKTSIMLATLGVLLFMSLHAIKDLLRTSKETESVGLLSAK